MWGGFVCWEGGGLYDVYIVYYESIKRELHKRLILECRCDARLELYLSVGVRQRLKGKTEGCTYVSFMISIRIKKDEGQGKEKCHTKSMMSKKFSVYYKR